MIQAIKIQNFQSHKDADITFSEGVNVIVGSSDSGKSSIIRALKWVTRNEPKGDGFRSWWGNDTLVTLRVDNSVIQRVRTNSDNLYKLDKTEFKAFGNDIPTEISALINFDEINLQQQLDKPFLLDETPGDIAKHFNRMAQLEKIDIGVKNANSLIRETENLIKFNDAEVKEMRGQIQEYNWLSEVDELIEQGEDLVEQKKVLQDKLTALKSIITKLEDVDELIELKSRILTADNVISNIITLNEKKKLLEAKKTAILSITDRLSIIDKNITRGSAVLPALPIIEKLIVLQEKYKTCKSLKIRISDLVYDINSINELISEKEKLHSNLVLQYNKEMPDVCPLCETKLK